MDPPHYSLEKSYRNTARPLLKGAYSFKNHSTPRDPSEIIVKQGARNETQAILRTIAILIEFWYPSHGGKQILDRMSQWQMSHQDKIQSNKSDLCSHSSQTKLVQFNTFNDFLCWENVSVSSLSDLGLKSHQAFFWIV